MALSKSISAVLQGNPVSATHRVGNAEMATLLTEMYAYAADAGVVVDLDSRLDVVEGQLVAGIKVKETVVAATTANVALTGAYTVDGVTVTNGQRYLAIAQTAPAQNGVYIYNSAGAHSRATDMDAAGIG